MAPVIIPRLTINHGVESGFERRGFTVAHQSSEMLYK